MQKYALKFHDGWAILEAEIPCNAGEGKIIKRGLTHDEMVQELRQ
jgi:hypothetical protein